MIVTSHTWTGATVACGAVTVNGELRWVSSARGAAPSVFCGMTIVPTIVIRTAVAIGAMGEIGETNAFVRIVPAVPVSVDGTVITGSLKVAILYGYRPTGCLLMGRAP
jgi:hypothetical protein